MVLRGGLLLALCLVFSLVFVAGEWEVNLQATLSDNNVAFQTLTSSSCSDDFDVYDFPALSIQNNYSIFYSSVGAYNLMVDCWDLPLGANKDRILNLTYYADSDYTGDLNITWDSGIFNRTFSAILNDYGADNSYTVLVSSINMSANNFYNVSVSSTTRYFQLIFDYDLYYCGDGIINGLETCEGTNFSGATCATYGYDTGSLSCNSSCLIVSSGCSNDNEDDDTGGGGGGGGTPTPTCTDGCNAGEKRCSNGYAQSCGNYDNDSCLEWQSLFQGTFCFWGCSSGECLSLVNQCSVDSDCSSSSCKSASCVNGSCVTSFVNGSCNDGNACTINDSCVSGVCRGQVKNCSDGESCTRDYCVEGECRSDFSGCGCSVDFECDDGNACTNNLCLNGTCVTNYNTNSCDDGNPCSEGETCSYGLCIGHQKECGVGFVCSYGECLIGNLLTEDKFPENLFFPSINVAESGGHKCEPIYHCGAEGICQLDYDFASVASGLDSIVGKQRILCNDFKKCGASFYQESECSIASPVLVQQDIVSDGKKFFVVDSITGGVVAEIVDQRKEKANLDIRFFSEEEVKEVEIEEGNGNVIANFLNLRRFLK